VFVTGGRALSEPDYSQRALCLRLSDRFIYLFVYYAAWQHGTAHIILHKKLKITKKGLKNQKRKLKVKYLRHFYGNKP